MIWGGGFAVEAVDVMVGIVVVEGVVVVTVMVGWVAVIVPEGVEFTHAVVVLGDDVVGGKGVGGLGGDATGAVGVADLGSRLGCSN